MWGRLLLGLCLGGSLAGAGADFDFSRFFAEKAAAYHEEAIRLRRELHQIPELCFGEKRTAERVEQYLRSLGLQVQTGLAGTGVKAVLSGGQPGSAIGLRADLDALPIAERTEAAWASRNPGVMHACGHDVHMANLLVAARMLSDVRQKLAGSVVFLFQPCEEGAPSGQAGGADALVAAKALEDPTLQAIVGMHVLPALPLGTVSMQAGPVTANVASFDLAIPGRASHGALPHQGVDAVYAAALAVVEFQALISRFRNPGDKAVLSIGTVHGGTRRNVIADEVRLEGTVRTYADAEEERIVRGMERILKGLDISLGTVSRLSVERANRCVRNDAGLVALARPVFQRALGPDRVVTMDPLTIGEDFSVYAQRIPALFFFLGTGSDTPLHTPNFSVDERILLLGPRLLAEAAVAYLCRSPGSCSN